MESLRLVRVLAVGLALGSVVPAQASAAGGAIAGPRPAPVTTAAPAPGCSTLSVKTCSLPLPSDDWTVADGSTATGRRVVLPANLDSAAVRAQLPSVLLPENIGRTADGFSALTPISLELVGPSNGAVPADGGDVVQVWDVTNGTRVPVRVEFDLEAKRRGDRSTVLTIWPVSRFAYGHRIVAFATRAIQTAQGGSMPASQSLVDALTGRLSVVGDFVEQRSGVARLDLVAVTQFTVRSEANATGPLDVLAAKVLAGSHPVRNIKVVPYVLQPGVGEIVTGQVRLTDFRDADGFIDVSNPGPGRDNWVDFFMTVPLSAAWKKAPVVIYGHGLGVFKETMLFNAGLNARRGAATIAIDQPNSGSREKPEGGSLLATLGSGQLPRLFGYSAQSNLDQLSLLAAVRGSLTNLDVAPYNIFRRTRANGRADLDTTQVHYQGLSLGVVLGSAFTGLAPNLKSAMLQIGGVGLMNQVTHSALMDQGVEPLAKPIRQSLASAITPTEAPLQIFLTQFAADHTEGANFVGRLRAKGTKTLLAYDIGDQLVPNRGSEALIRIAGLPLAGPVLDPLAGVPRVGGLPADGFAAVQLPTIVIKGLPGILGSLANLVTHVTVIVTDVPAVATWLNRTL